MTAQAPLPDPFHRGGPEEVEEVTHQSTPRQHVLVSRRSLLLAAACGAWAQEAKFSADVNVVTLFATVRDGEGRIARNLAQDDFVLLEDGVPQPIRYFSRESNLALTIGLLVDTSQSQSRVLEPERAASYAFLDQVLREGTDQAFVAHFDIRVEVLQRFTSSRQELADGLARLRLPGKRATLLFDAIPDCSEYQMRKHLGRKAFILLSDGVDVKSKTPIEAAIEYAQRADTMIYSILFAGQFHPAALAVALGQGIGAARGRKAMRRMALETGGEYFEVTKDDPIEKIYARIEEALRNQYSLGYSPSRAGSSGQYRKIQLTTKQRGLMVTTRDGYYTN